MSVCSVFITCKNTWFGFFNSLARIFSCRFSSCLRRLLNDSCHSTENTSVDHECKFIVRRNRTRQLRDEYRRPWNRRQTLQRAWSVCGQQQLPFSAKAKRPIVCKCMKRVVARDGVEPPSPALSGSSFLVFLKHLTGVRDCHKYLYIRIRQNHRGTLDSVEVMDGSHPRRISVTMRRLSADPAPVVGE